jgi:hypothetical protein
MAYILGYWWADGCMRVKPGNGAHEIELSGNDLDHLHTIARTIGGNYALRRVSARHECHAIAFCSKQMYHDLLALGGTPRKSKTIGFPDVPPDLLPHFVRGVVDGDGTLSWNAGKPVLHIYSGSKPFLLAMGAAIEQATGIPAGEPIVNRTLWYAKWSTIRAKCLAFWLYIDHPGLALNRKAAKAAAFLDWHPRKTPERGTITDEMRRVFPEYLLS